MELPAILTGRHGWGVSLKHLKYGEATTTFLTPKSQFDMELHSTSQSQGCGTKTASLLPHNAFSDSHLLSYSHDGVVTYHHVYSRIEFLGVVPADRSLLLNM
eukprot:5374004-Amphidinium_carterae.1